MENEVCYEKMRPGDVRRAREACPVAYIPIGTIEWHGIHNPVGLDGLKAHALSVRCAREGGGLVFPALFYGENRENGLLDSSATSGPIAEALGLPPENLAPGHMRRGIAEQDDLYQQLLRHVLFQVYSLGFRVAVFCAGHYPLIDHAKAAAHIFHQQTRRENRKMIPWAFMGYELVSDQYSFAGDHAAYWETCLALALLPGLSDLSLLPDDPKDLVGVRGRRPPHEASAEDGEKYVKAIIERVVAKVRERLENTREFVWNNLRF